MGPRHVTRDLRLLPRRSGDRKSRERSAHIGPRRQAVRTARSAMRRGGEDEWRAAQPAKTDDDQTLPVLSDAVGGRVEDLPGDAVPGVAEAAEDGGPGAAVLAVRAGGG